MIDINDEFFQLQARTKLAKGGGTATIFAAAVAKEESTSTVQVAMKEGGQLTIRVFFFLFYLRWHPISRSMFLTCEIVCLDCLQEDWKCS